MADFRRSLIALAVLALLVGFASTASAQGPAFSCSASAAVPPQLRSEGLTELTGDVVLNCTGGTPVVAGTVIPQANFAVFLNTTVTSRLLTGNSSSEALLLIDEPVAGTVTICDPANAGGGTACANTAGAAVAFNAIRGIVSGNSVTFLGVPVNPPGTAGTRIFRITNVRANASAISAGAAGVPGQIVASVAISASTSIPVNNPINIVGFVQAGLSPSLRNAGNSDTLSTSNLTFRQCTDQSRKTAAAVLRYSEGFATSFKTRTTTAGQVTAVPMDSPTAPQLQNSPGTIYNSESGYMPSTVNQGDIGVADFGTRLKATFNNVPAGASVYVTIYNINPSTTLFARLVGSEGGAFFAVPATNTDVTAIGTGTTSVAQLPIVNNTAMAVWEVLASDPLATQNYDFGVYFGWTAAVGTNSPAPGIGTVSQSFAPTPPSFSAADGAKAQGLSFPIPRFVDTSTAKNVLSVVVCRTNLLFPFTPNVAGFDTGIEISNTSMDPFGTSPQAGTCTLNWYGNTANGGPAPPATPVASIAGGGTYANLVSTLAPGFNGYMIAVCNFQYAHGFAYIYSRDLSQAQGYLALIIPDPPRSASVIAAGGEQLVQ